MRRPLLRAFLSLCAAVAASRCDCGSPVDSPGSTLPDQCQVDAPQLAAQQTDILFVIDNSDSMTEEQAEVANELSAFVAALQQGAGLAQDFQVGVVTTSVYLNAVVNGQDIYQEYPTQSGRLQAVPSTGERLLKMGDPDLVSKFNELVHQGTSGSGQETAFEAARLALASDLALQPIAQGGNQELLRPGARLLVVVVGDEDDCSELPPRPPQVRISNDRSVDDCAQQAALLTPVSTYYDIFQSLDDGFGAPREVLWATIGPVALTDKRAELIVDNGVAKNADCPTSAGAGFRMHDLAQRYDPQLDNLTSICSPSYHDALIEIAALATLGQSVDVMSAPDERLMQVQIVRQDGTVDLCTTANNGIRFRPKTGEQPARIYFQNQCLRRPADQSVTVKQLCAG